MTTFGVKSIGWRDALRGYASVDHGTREEGRLVRPPPRRGGDHDASRRRVLDRLRIFRRGSPRAAGSDPPAERPDLTGRADPATCPHADLVELGAGGRARYYRCAACGSSLVVQDGRTWAIRPLGTKSSFSGIPCDPGSPGVG